MQIVLFDDIDQVVDALPQLIKQLASFDSILLLEQRGSLCLDSLVEHLPITGIHALPDSGGIATLWIIGQIEKMLNDGMCYIALGQSDVAQILLSVVADEGNVLERVIERILYQLVNGCGAFVLPPFDEICHLDSGIGFIAARGGVVGQRFNGDKLLGADLWPAG